MPYFQKFEYIYWVVWTWRAEFVAKNTKIKFEFSISFIKFDRTDSWNHLLEDKKSIIV